MERLPGDRTVTHVTSDGRRSAHVSRHLPRVEWTDSTGAHVARIAGRTVVGSAPGVDVVVADPTVSRLHAELEPTDAGVWVRDLGSRNGTRVGGLRVTGVCLPDGGRVQLGGAELVLRYEPTPTAIEVWPDERFGALVGRSVTMREVFARLARVARIDATVMIQGETGTGKELVAQAIHDASPRAERPFVIVDCGALPEHLLESELFGHARGAFTGAVAARAGAIELADGGTVFLDEVGELPLALQPKLLRALESRMVRRLGEGQYRKVDVRFIAATHRDLREMVNQGAFREDLYFRLVVVPITLPPLRARPDDIAALVQHFGVAQSLTAEHLADLERRPWLGNVRELRNLLDRIAALGADEALGGSASPAPVRASTVPGEGMLPAVPLDRAFKDIREQWLDHLEREYVRGLLAQHGRNVAAVAQAAGLTRAYVYRLMQKHEL